jgi:ATP phosphoribosyltransferase
VGGSVEAACALGMADGIVDLVGKLSSHHSLQQPLR